MNDMGESHKTELLFDDFIGLMPEAIIVVNSEGKVVQFNNKAEKLFDYKKNGNYSAYKTLSMATMLYFYNILGISKSILKDICHQFFTKSYQMYFRYQ